MIAVAAGAPSRRTADTTETRAVKPATWIQTPVVLTGASASMQALLQSFAETLDPFNATETVRYVRGAFTEIVSTAASPSVAGLLIMLTPAVEPLTLADKPTPSEAVRAFDRLVAELGVSQKDLFQATGISKRTYHSWTGLDAPTPRQRSLGRLWPLVDAVSDLQVVLDRPVQHWLHADPGRRRLLLRGEFGQLVEVAVADTRRSRRLSDRTAVAADVAMPILRGERAAIDDVDEGPLS